MACPACQSNHCSGRPACRSDAAIAGVCFVPPLLAAVFESLAFLHLPRTRSTGQISDIGRTLVAAVGDMKTGVAHMVENHLDISI